LAAAPDGRFVVGGGDDGSLRLFRLKDQSNPNLLKCPDGKYYDLAFHPKEQMFALAQSTGSIEIWDRLGHKRLRTLSGHKGNVFCVAYSPDGKQLASGSRDKTIRIWSPSSTKPTKVLVGHESNVSAIAFSPDNQRLASISNDKTLKIWDLAQGKVTKSIRTQNQLMRRVTWSSDGDRVAVGAEFGAASVFDITTGRRVLRRPHLMMAYSPDGKHLVSANRNDVVVHDAVSGKEINVLRGHLNPVLDVMVTNQGERVISLDVGGIIKVWGMRTGQELLTITANSDDQLPSQVSIGRLVIGPNDRTLGLAQYNGRIKIWHTKPTDPREQAKP
jgi:WD40 repeat protein